MPTRNRVKAYVSGSYYHIYNRGVNKRRIFLDDYDYAVFLNLIKRYLDKHQPETDRWGRVYEQLHDEIELLAFCLMPNHFHLLIYQISEDATTKLLRRVCGAYTVYFNNKYNRVGPLFQGTFKAAKISSNEYLQYISRYIHLNPPNYQTWGFSSLPYYINSQNAGWLKPDRILELFENGEYKRFVSDYSSHKRVLDEIKYELANVGELLPIFARSNPAKGRGRKT